MLSSSCYLSPFFLSLLLTASLPPSSQSSSSLLLLPHFSPSTFSLPLSLLLPLLYLSPSLLSSSYYLSPFFLSFLLTASLPPFSQSSSSLLLLPHSSPSTSSLSLSLLPLSHSLPLLPLNPPPHYLSLLLHPSHYLSPSFLWHPPHYRSPSFISILTTSLPHSYPSSSLPLSLLPLNHPHYLSPSFLPVILTTSPSFIPFNPPPHYLSSLSCNIIIHLITSVFLPSPSSLLTLPNYLLRILFSSVVIIILLITSSSLLLSSSFTFITSSFLSYSFKSPLQYLFHYFLIIILLTISILFHIDSLPYSSLSSSLFYTSSISPSSPSSFYHSPSVLSILLFIFLPSCPLPHTCQLCLPALSKLEFFSLALRKIALSLVFSPSFPPTSLSVLTPCSCLP